MLSLSICHQGEYKNFKCYNNQIKDELVNFVMHCSEPEAAGERIAPLLTIDEIVQSVAMIDTFAVKARGFLL